MLQALCTIIVCTYLIVLHLVFIKSHTFYVILGLQILMLIFWITDLGLVAYLARLWQQPKRMDNFTHRHQHAPYKKRDSHNLQRKDIRAYNTFSEALVAGAVLAAFEM